jgi:hypothetical protein
LVLLIIALSGILIGGAILFISLLVRAVRRFKEYKAGDVGSLFPKSDKKSDSF